jgi:hypothetical protein
MAEKQLTSEDVEKIINSMQGKQETKKSFMLPPSLMAEERRGKLGNTGCFATVVELTTLDYLIVKGFLDQEEHTSEETKNERLSILLSAMSLKSIEVPDKNGKLQVINMPPVSTLSDLLERVKIKPTIWIEIAKLSQDINNPDSVALGK